MNLEWVITNRRRLYDIQEPNIPGCLIVHGRLKFSNTKLSSIDKLSHCHLNINQVS